MLAVAMMSNHQRPMRVSATLAVVTSLLLVTALPRGKTDSMDEERGQRARVESARRQLRKTLLGILGLKDAPRVDAGVRIPDYMLKLYTSRTGDEEERTMHFKRPFAQDANTVRSYLHVGTKKESGQGHVKGVDIYFNLSSWPESEAVTLAELRLFRESLASGSHGDAGTTVPLRIEVYDVVKKKGDSREDVAHLLDTRHGSADAAQYETLDITSAVARSLKSPAARGIVRIRVRAAPVVEQGAGGRGAAGVRLRRAADVGINEWTDSRPLLLVYSHDRRHGQRTKRSAPSNRKLRSRPADATTSASRPRPSSRADTACRRHKLWVDFSEVGWKDWIVAPLGYDAYFCQGECAFPLPDHLNTTNHAIVQTLVNAVDSEVVPRVCCVPTELSPISMLYLDETQKVVLKNYQEMVVEGCGCR